MSTFKLPEHPRVDIYNRCSTEKNEQISALRSQAEESREIALSKGWTIVHQYEEFYTGTSGDKRDYYQQLIEDITNKEIDVVMIKSIDRLNRNTTDWSNFVATAVRYKVGLYFYLDNKWYDEEEPLIFNIYATMAAQFSIDLSKKIKNAHKTRREKLTHPNITREMFGWNRISDPETHKYYFEINEKEAELYRTACSLVEQGYGFRRIAKELASLGAKPHQTKTQRKNNIQPKPFSSVSWRKMLLSERYCGDVWLHQDETNFFNNKERVPIPKDEWILAKDMLPPIITREYHTHIVNILTERAQETKEASEEKARREETTPPPATPDTENSLPQQSTHVFGHRVGNKTRVSFGKHLYTKRIVCSCCGANYQRSIVTTKRKDPSSSNPNQPLKIPTWRCATYNQVGIKTSTNLNGCSNIKLEEKELNHIIEEAIKEHYNNIYLNEDSLIEQMIILLKQTFKGDELIRKQTSLKKQLEENEQKLKTMLDKLASGTLDDEGYMTFSKANKEEHQMLADNLKCISDNIQEMKSGAERLVNIKEKMKSEQLVDKARTNSLTKKIEKIVVYPSENFNTRGRNNIGYIKIYFSLEQILGITSQNSLKSLQKTSEAPSKPTTEETTEDTPECTPSNIEVEDNSSIEVEDNSSIEVEDNSKYYVVTKEINRIRPEEQRAMDEEEKLYNYIKDNPKATMPQMEEYLGLKNTTVYYRLKSLKEQGRAVYKRSQGSKGHWEVM